MTRSVPIHVAASGLEGLVWLIVAIIWFVFQGLATAAKKKQPPAQRPTPPMGEPEQPIGGELRDFIETLTGQKAEPSEDEEAPAPPRSSPEPVPARATHFPRQPAAIRHTAPPPVVARLTPTPPMIAPPLTVAAQRHTTEIRWRIAPVMRMRWPRSALGNLSVTAATRAGHASPLHRRLTGSGALRHAMINRIVLGRPLGD